MKILLVEDDPLLSQFLLIHFGHHRHTVDVAMDGNTGLQLAYQGSYDVILLDVMVPQIDGISVCQQLRNQGCQTPILMLTAKGENDDIVSGLDAGADDYVTKPCDPSQLLARLRALVRRCKTDISSAVLQWGELQLDPIAIQVTYQQQVISLSPKEYSLLELFLRNPQRIFSRSVIIDRLWSIDDSPTDAAVTNLVKDLRHKLKASGLDYELIETVYRMGYRLKAPPELHSSEAQTHPYNPESSDARLDKQPTGQPYTQSQQEGIALIHQLAYSFESTLDERMAVLEEFGRSLTQALNSSHEDHFIYLLAPEQRERVRLEAHRLAGGLGTFGYSQGSDAARSIERLMVEAAAFDMSQAQRYLVLVNQLKQAIAAPPQDRSDRSYIEGAEPASKLRQNRFLDAEHHKLSEQGLTYDRDHWEGTASVVLMIDIEPSVVDAFRPLAAAQALQLVTVSDSVEAQNWLKQHSPRCTVVSLRQVLRMMDRDSGLESLKADDDSPVIALANRNTLEDRRIATNAGCDRYLLTSSPPEILVEAIVEAIAQKSANVAARVMIVDDDPLALKAFMTLLQPWGLQVICLSNPEQFWTVLTATHPDMILLDLEMPHFSGLELCRIVRQDMRYGDIPILVVTAHADMDTLQRAFEAGADDFIHKPIVGPELISRMICRLERIRLQHHRPSIRQNGSTPEQNESIPNALTQITLTQIANQQDFHDYLTQEWQRLGDRYAFLSLILCGIDDFDQYCDRHGSLAGDLALRQIAQVIQQCAIFRLDLVAHYKQDIFAVVLPETDLTGALRVGERIRQAIEEKYLSERDSSSPMPDGEIQGLTLSLGITGTIPNPAQTLHDFIAIADQALYAAKTKGGNTYCLYPL